MKSGFRLGDEMRGVAIEQFRPALQALKPVSKPCGNQECGVIFGRECFCMPLEESGRIPAKIDSNIPNRSPNARNQLGFTMRRHLVMKPANRSHKLRPCVIDLGNRPGPPGCSEFFGAKQPAEKTPLIAKNQALDFFQTG